MALSVDTSVAAVASSASTATTAAFTATPNTLLLAMITLDAPSSTSATGTMSDTAGLSWTLAIRQNASASSNGGSAEIWWAVTASGFTAKTVTVTNSSTTANSQATELRVVQFHGYLPGSPIGATAGADLLLTTNFTQAITTTADSSWVWGKILNYTTSATLTANAATSILAQGNDGDGDQYATFAQTSVTTPPAVPPGTNLTLGGTFAASARGHIACVEILQSPTVAGATVAWFRA